MVRERPDGQRRATAFIFSVIIPGYVLRYGFSKGNSFRQNLHINSGSLVRKNLSGGPGPDGALWWEGQPRDTKGSADRSKCRVVAGTRPHATSTGAWFTLSMSGTPAIMRPDSNNTEGWTVISDPGHKLLPPQLVQIHNATHAAFWQAAHSPVKKKTKIWESASSNGRP